MHEVGLTRQIVALCLARAGGRRVTRVRLEIGALAAVLPEAIRFAFDACVQDTPLAGAELEILIIPGRASCLVCGGEFALHRPYGRCACGSTQIRCIAGEELLIRDLEVRD